MLEQMTSAVALLAIALVVYHHAIYPYLAKLIGRRAKIVQRTSLKDDECPELTVVVPAYNEARMIERKIENLAVQDYPQDRMSIIIVCDGCTDDTVKLARYSASRFPDLKIDVIEFVENRGKVRVLNDVIPRIDSSVTVLTDVSARFAADAIRRLSAHFLNANIGAVGARYEIANPENSGERAYWRYQTALKLGESTLGGLIGAHGALYAIRTKAFDALPEDTINDDFVIPMQISSKGYRTIYDPTISGTELEVVSTTMDFRRRMRIGAGNMQQCLRLIRLLNPYRAGLAFAFFSGKVLRTFMPLCLLVALVASLLLARDSTFFASVAILQLLGYTIAASRIFFSDKTIPKLVSSLQYFLGGYIASGIGALLYLLNMDTRKTGSLRASSDVTTLSRPTAFAKRSFDIVIAIAALAVSLPLFPIISLAIKLESPGPVLFRQLRVGRLLKDRAELFQMIKFRSMRTDAEASSGPVWASENDPRITRIGMFLRKTRLDELPQLLNVLRGDMSLIGPRPERPSFCGKLNDAIPYYMGRTHSLRPGITGLAQVNQGYDETLDDVRRKVMYDYTYAARVSSFADWLRTDFSILFQTISVMVFARGR